MTIHLENMLNNFWNKLIVKTYFYYPNRSLLGLTSVRWPGPMIKVCRKKSKVNRDAWTHRRMLHGVQNVSRVKWRTRMLWSTAPKELRRKKRHSGISIPTRRGVWSHACLPTWLVRGVVGRTGKSSDYFMVLAIEVKIWSTIRNTKKQEEVDKT